MDNKTDLRKYAKDKRQNLPINDISHKIIETIKKSDSYLKSNNIMIFYPTKYEINLLPLLEDKTKNFYLPRVSGENIEVCTYKIGDKLIKSTLGIYEPISPPTGISDLDIVFTPALMADMYGYRLGYGGGYYDRLLKDFTALKIITIPDELLKDKLPVEPFDVRCDYILTQTKTIRIK